MGNSVHVDIELKPSELNQCLSSSNFTEKEIKALWYHYRTICRNSVNDDGYIAKKQFQSAILFKDSVLLDRIFRVFDYDDDGRIDFFEYISCLSAISSKSTKDERLKFSFQIYDFDGDGLLSPGDLTAVVAATLREQKIVVTRADLDVIVRRTIDEANPAIEDMISLDEYMKMVQDKSQMIDHLTVNISNIIAEYTANDTISLVTPR